MQSWRSSHHSTARHAPFSSQSQPASPCLILHLAFCTTSPHHRNASPRPALDRNISRRTIPTIHISPSTSSRPSLPKPITTFTHLIAYRHEKNNFSSASPYSGTNAIQLYGCLAAAQHAAAATMPASVTPTPPSSRAPTYVCTHAVPGSRLPGAAWRSSVSSSSPSFPTPFLA